MNQPMPMPENAIAIEISAKRRSCEISRGLDVSAPVAEFGASSTGATAGRPSIGSGFGDNHIGSLWAPRSEVSLAGTVLMIGDRVLSKSLLGCPPARGLFV